MKKICLLLVMLSCIASSYATRWELKPWQKYLIEQKVNEDTIAPKGSIMFANITPPNRLKVADFRIPYFRVPEQKSLLDQWDEERRKEKIARGDYTHSDFVLDMIGTILTSFFN